MVLPPSPRALVASLAAAVVAIAVFLAARRSVHAVSIPRPNVLLVVLDTTRRDHLSLHGYARETSPRLDRLASEATVFTRAYSTSSWTSPAHASLFTGLYPEAHHVTQEAWSMPDELVTLAEVLRDDGYRTAAMVGNPMAGRSLGFAQGFESFRETWREHDAGDARRHPAVQGLEELVDVPSPRPFFAFVNLIEPHTPYDDGPHIEDFDRHPENPLKSNRWQAYVAGETAFSDQDLEHLVDLYDGEVRYADAVVGSLLDVLAERGLLENTVVVVTADHGENFGEHGLMDHVFNLYEETTRVPLLFRYPPRFGPGVRDDPVQLHDIAPTLLSLVGARPIEGTQGLDLSRGPVDPARPVLLAYGFPVQALSAVRKHHEAEEALAVHARRLWALREGDWKLILGGDGRRELYDLAVDPHELSDLAATPEGAARADELQRALESLLESVSRGERRGLDASTLDDATLAEMRKLGYDG